jgi:AAA15 family ATPase/GTPase
MKTKLTINKLFAYSERNNKYFYTEFDDSVNIIYGKNTSGKSTIFQAIMYTLGINDNNQYLREILEEDIFFRIDCRITKSKIDENIIFIRDDETIFIAKK